MQRAIAIVGRPNVGKSTLFNRLVGRRQALVHDEPGVTRDRLFGSCTWGTHRWWVVDTGGMLMGEDALSAEVTTQSQRAMDEADAIICLLDGREGMTLLDEEVVQLVRRANRPVLYVVNKCEHQRPIEDFYRLGVDPLIPVSAEHGDGVAELCEEMTRVCASPCAASAASATAALRVALIGRPNVGKSTLINALAGDRRVVAHDLPGTTRDVIDVEITRYDTQAIFLDTAGIRRKARTTTPLEKFSVIKALQAVLRADVVVMLIDATEGLTHQDGSLCAEAAAQGRPVVVALNKWDLLCAARRVAGGVQSAKRLERDGVEAVRHRLGALSRLPIVCLSARTSFGLDHLWGLIHRYGRAVQRRLTTGALNRLLEQIQQDHHLPVYRGHNVKLFYMTQTGTRPPRFTTFTNFPHAIPVAYRRYLMRHLEQALGAEGVPMSLVFRKK